METRIATGNGKNRIAQQPPTSEAVVIHRMRWNSVLIQIIGETSYISNAFSKEKLDAMLAKQTAPKKATGKGRQPREARNIEQEWRGTLRAHGKGYGIPCAAFHSAMVRAAKNIEGLNMKDAKELFRVEGDLATIEGPAPVKRMDCVKNADGSPDVRFRAEFQKWRTIIQVKYNADVLSAESIFNLCYRAGQTVGIGDLRPSPRSGAPGTHGTWNVEPVK